MSGEVQKGLSVTLKAAGEEDERNTWRSRKVSEGRWANKGVFSPHLMKTSKNTYPFYISSAPPRLCSSTWFFSDTFLNRLKEKLKPSVSRCSFDDLQSEVNKYWFKRFIFNSRKFETTTSNDLPIIFLQLSAILYFFQY